MLYLTPCHVLNGCRALNLDNNLNLFVDILVLSVTRMVTYNVTLMILNFLFVCVCVCVQVFFSSSVFSSNVMVAVATKVADNPVSQLDHHIGFMVFCRLPW